MRQLFLRLSLVVLATGLLGGCAHFSHHPKKPHSYDRSVSDESQDPTYREDNERADVEVRDAQ